MNRRVRPELGRIKPIRNVVHHLWSSASAGGAGDDKMADGPLGPKSVNKIISDAVDLGYNVIEAQIRQGQQAAEHFRSGAYSASHAEEDVKKLMDRIMYLVKELSVVGFDLASAILRDARSSSGKGPQSDSSSSKGPQSDIAIQIQSKKRVEVNYRLSPTAAHFEPSISPLHAADREVAPLKNIRFETKHHRPVLVVEVPDAQPAGKYTGVITDAKSNEAGGFISVTILT